MKTILFSLFLLFLFSFSYSQDDNSNVAKEEICYVEWLEGEMIHSTFLVNYKRNNYIFNFQSGFSIRIQNDIFIDEFIEIIAKFSSTNSNTKRTFLGSYRTNFDLKSPSLNPAKKHIQSLGQQISYYKYYIENEEMNGYYLEISIPSTKYFASNSKSPQHSVFIPEKCVNAFIQSFKSL